MTPARRAGRAYVVRMLVIAVLYVGVVFVRKHYMHAALSPALHAAVIAAPVLPIWFMLLAVWRYYVRIDEFAQRRMLQILSLSFGLSACTIVSYAFLSDLGLPQVDLLTAWPIMALIWLALTFGAKMRDRVGKDEK
jgi:hypothetical protein